MMACRIGFLRGEVYMDSCICQTCSAPVMSVSFVLKECTNISDSVIAMCSVCDAGNTFRAMACQRSADTVCHVCTPARPGRLLLTPCTLVSDALYAGCHEGRACNGTEIHFACRAPSVALNGVCVCPPATSSPAAYYSSSQSLLILLQQQDGSALKCEAISCPSRMYPNPETGGCSVCTVTAPDANVMFFYNYDLDAAKSGMLNLTLSAPGVVGFDACGCKEGYLRRRALGANGNPISVGCWPCGNLGCTLTLQRQAPQCDGFGEDEPQCQCAPGPAALIKQPSSLYPEELCNIECAPGFRRLFPQTNLGRFDRYSYLRLPPPFMTRRIFRYTIRAYRDFDNNLNNNNNNNDSLSNEIGCLRPVSGAGSVGSAALLLACGDGTVYVVRTDTGESEPLDLLPILEIPGWRKDIRVTALKQHTALPGLMWVVRVIVLFA
jgi:hypothetical protein